MYKLFDSYHLVENQFCSPLSSQASSAIFHEVQVIISFLIALGLSSYDLSLQFYPFASRDSAACLQAILVS